eukprot:scaffold84674_cov61-Phaeocystis_antarctica.AAC.1
MLDSASRRSYSARERREQATPCEAIPYNATPLMCRARRVAWLEVAWERSSSGTLRSPCGASAQGSNWPRFGFASNRLH